ARRTVRGPGREPLGLRLATTMRYLSRLLVGVRSGWRSTGDGRDAGALAPARRRSGLRADARARRVRGGLRTPVPRAVARSHAAFLPHGAVSRQERAGARPRRESAEPQVLEGCSTETVATYWRRFRWAVLEFQRLWPRRWSRRADESAAVRVPKRHRSPKPREVGEDRSGALVSQLLSDREWRAAAALMVARASGRRIGAIAGHRPGLHLDAPPLTAADFAWDSNGRLLVTWRAEVAKGGGYGRGDEVQVAPRELAVVYRWLTRYHPNPLGPTYPLIWDADDPAAAASYDGLTSAFS